MPNLNLVQLMGNLTRDPEVKYTPKGTAICGFGLAVNRHWTNESGEKQEEVTFVDVTFWGARGEVIAKYLTKGKPLYVQGRLKLETWDDKATGQKRSKLTVIGEGFEFLGGKREESGEDEPPPARSGRPAPPPKRPPADPDLDPMEDDIPF